MEKLDPKKIKKEENRLFKAFGAKDEKALPVAGPLIKRAAFMRVWLEFLEKDIKENGTTEMFSQSDKTEPYERRRPTADLYNTLIKNYNTVIKTLNDIMGEDGSGGSQKTNGFFDFAEGKRSK